MSKDHQSAIEDFSQTFNQQSLNRVNTTALVMPHFCFAMVDQDTNADQSKLSYQDEELGTEKYLIFLMAEPRVIKELKRVIKDLIHHYPLITESRKFIIVSMGDIACTYRNMMEAACHICHQFKFSLASFMSQNIQECSENVPRLLSTKSVTLGRPSTYIRSVRSSTIHYAFADAALWIKNNMFDYASGRGQAEMGFLTQVDDLNDLQREEWIYKLMSLCPKRLLHSLPKSIFRLVFNMSLYGLVSRQNMASELSRVPQNLQDAHVGNIKGQCIHWLLHVCNQGHERTVVCVWCAFCRKERQHQG
ncbi:hypothetical protein AKO1_013625 [Acrasis kona]|uniref:Uncharacterized protein n=1 Tax=Acrasis kona TaxID=1008807 RepID=A0AAW2YU25_9EUKA